MAPNPVADRQWAAALLANLDSIRAEVRRVHRREFSSWPETVTYLGDWLTLPLVGGRPVSGGALRCPRTTKLLRSLGALRATVFRMEPGCHVLAHQRSIPAQGIQVELGIAVPRGTFNRRAGIWQQLPEGQLVIRTQAEEAETVHYGRDPRLLLIADFAR